MTQNPNLLNAYDLSVTVRLSMSLNDRVRERLREIKAEKDVSHRDLAGFTGWSQAKVGQKLLGETEITLDELETLCFALGIQPTEAVRDRGLEFCAEMTPTELRLLELIRRLPRAAYDGLLHFMQVNPKAGAEPRGATKKRDGYGPTRASRR
jgi:transcriptional regulator with XRE-family HTH domain